jgi:hypothetical protein
MRTIADRPLGVLLSGGIDSTVVASRLAQQRMTSYRTYTAAFPGSDMDESPAARETAAALGLPNTPIIVPDHLEHDFSRIVAALDEPFADPSSFPSWYLAREVSREVKVVLAGDGGDELFAGYKRVAKHLRTAWRGTFRLPLEPRPALEGGKLAAELAMDWRSAYSLRFSGFAPAQRAFLQGGRRLSSLVHWREPDFEARDPNLAAVMTLPTGVDRKTGRALRRGGPTSHAARARRACPGNSHCRARTHGRTGGRARPGVRRRSHGSAASVRGRAEGADLRAPAPVDRYRGRAHAGAASAAGGAIQA